MRSGTIMWKCAFRESYGQHRPWSDCAFAQSDQGHCCPAVTKKIIGRCRIYQQITKADQTTEVKPNLGFFSLHMFIDPFPIAVLHKNICCRYSLKACQQSTSNEYPQHVFSWRNKKIIMFLVAKSMKDTMWFGRAHYKITVFFYFSMKTYVAGTH